MNFQIKIIGQNSLKLQHYYNFNDIFFKLFVTLQITIVETPGF